MFYNALYIVGVDLYRVKTCVLAVPMRDIPMPTVEMYYPYAFGIAYTKPIIKRGQNILCVAAVILGKDNVRNVA